MCKYRPGNIQSQYERQWGSSDACGENSPDRPSYRRDVYDENSPNLIDTAVHIGGTIWDFFFGGGGHPNPYG